MHTLQERLNAWHPTYGYSAIAVDGAFGSHTESTVRDFQQHAGLTVDGVVGPTTWDDLFKAPSAPNPPKVLPDADLSATPHTTVSRFIDVARGIEGYKGAYVTTLKDKAGNILDSSSGSATHIMFIVRAPGEYTITTSATGYTSTVRTVTVA